ncbi:MULTISPECIES: DUF3732 domain-containing protein [Providencia]|uniref:DUF3732 domain-containing protein n=1 Tax=Providencia TaxID=586 RepID=UPI00234981FC|nr:MULTISPECIES: DUF3732 domain-containing protein [unclassified Providencia]
MFFQIKKLILWPKKNKKPRIVEFELGKVNIISGASKTGKSAVIPIIDYCLCADKCAIPVGVIRESCSWFGILIETTEGPKLLARKEPGTQQSTKEMYFLEGDEIIIPEKSPKKNTNASYVKTVLDRLSGLSNLAFEASTTDNFRSRPAFRDLMAFLFQPQNIIANPDVLFFKADTTEHREKLKTIFPYILGAISPLVLQARHELDKVTRKLHRKETELKMRQVSSDTWQSEGRVWLFQAIEYGLLPTETNIPQEWSSILKLLQTIQKKDPNLAQPSVDSIQNIVNELKNLRERETNIVTEFNILRNQLIEIEKLNESSDLYKKALNIKRERLSLSTWIRDKYHSADVTESLNGTYSSDKIQQLCQALEGIELRLRSYPQINQSLGKETLYLRTQLSELTHKLSLVREEIKLLELASEQAGRSNRQNELVAHFLGRLEEAMRLYQTTDTLTPLNNEIKELKKEQKRLFKIVSEKDIAKKLDSVLNKVQRNIGRILPYLDSEWPDSPVSLIIPDLTVKVNRGGRDDYLWETGSGANWLAYHIATTLALQWIFSQLKHHPVPGLLIYDQPSQVYFPVRKAEKSAIDSNDPHWQDEDIVAVRKVFNTLDMFISATKKEFQIIVLDHANEDVWYDLDNVHLVEEWRGKALVPYEWKDESI